jgi:uncharacterized protein YecE (DUF72 family)
MILIGTSGYSFADWVGPFYPSGTPRGAMLEYYARHFPVAEINATYYRIPTPRSFAAMAQRTPEEFKFVVKAHRSMTHERDEIGANIDGFRECLKPLDAAGKLSGVLLQFPWSFKHGPAALDHLTRVRAELSEPSLFAEFRHVSWVRDDVFAFLTDHRIGYCAVDEPDLPGLVPPVVRVTSSEGYVRFHGRNKGTWWGDAEGDRYDYRYSKPELAEWVDKIRALDARTDRTFVFFNNCHGGQAVDGARLMAQLLEIDLGGPRSEGA